MTETKADWLRRTVATATDRTPCVPWPWATSENGLGCLRIDGVTWQANRAAWHLAHPGEEVPRLGRSPECAQRNCVNPHHWAPATRRDVNQYAKRTSCDRGHVYTVESARVTPEGYRVCRVCARARDRRARLIKTYY